MEMTQIHEVVGGSMWMTDTQKMKTMDQYSRSWQVGGVSDGCVRMCEDSCMQTVLALAQLAMKANGG